AVPATFRLMLWQTLVAAWPLQLPGRRARTDYAGRVVAWATKALREGKQYSSWTEPDAGVEGAVDALVRHALEDNALHQALAAAAAALGVPGARLGLAQLLLRLATPGVPDTYQGSEGWDLSLVDPDNRRPVDYAARRAWLDDPRDWPALLRQWQDGALTARLLATMLELRAAHPRLVQGRYTPQPAGTDVVAFLRGSGHQRLWAGALVGDAAAVQGEGLLLPEAHWEARSLRLPAGHWREVLGGARLGLDSPGNVPLSTLFARSPVAVWTTARGMTPWTRPNASAARASSRARSGRPRAAPTARSCATGAWPSAGWRPRSPHARWSSRPTKEPRERRTTVPTRKWSRQSRLEEGTPYPLGATWDGLGVNFALYSR